MPSLKLSAARSVRARSSADRRGIHSTAIPPADFPRCSHFFTQLEVCVCNGFGVAVAFSLQRSKAGERENRAGVLATIRSFFRNARGGVPRAYRSLPLSSL